MREIKFRGWIEDQKKMFNVDVLALSPVTWDSGGTGVSLAYQPHIEVMQYTGLIDKNGTKIFEGDVFKREFEIGKNIYDEHSLGFIDYEIEDSGYFVGVVSYRPSQGFILNKCLKFNDEDELKETKNGIKIYPKRGKVIGNIHEHPHLLEVPNEKR